MQSMLGTYLRELAQQAVRSSWAAANGLEGALLGGGIMIWRGVIGIFPGETAPAVAGNWSLSFIAYAMISWAILFIFRVVFVSPFQVWKTKGAAVAALTLSDEIFRLHDVWLYDAIWRIFSGKWESPPIDSNGIPGMGEAQAKRFSDLVKEVRQRMFDGQLPIWARLRGSDLWTSVPKEYWKNFQLNCLTVMIPGAPKDLVVELGSREAYLEQLPLNEWLEFKTSRAAVERICSLRQERVA